MEKTRGRILSILPDGSRATVEVDTATFCERCASGKGCGAGIFGSGRGPRCFEAPIVDHAEVKAGDEVQIELAPQSVLRAAWIVYGIPLGGALVAAGIAYVAGMTDGWSLLAIIAGLVLGGYIGRRRLRGSDCLRQFTPIITQRLAGAE